MMIDNELLFAENLAFGGTPKVLDLGPKGKRPGPGEPIVGFITGNGLTGATGVTITTGDTTTAGDALTVVSGPIVNGLLEFRIPSSAKRYLKIALVGATAGTYTAGLVMEGVQTSQ